MKRVNLVLILFFAVAVQLGCGAKPGNKIIVNGVKVDIKDVNYNHLLMCQHVSSKPCRIASPTFDQCIEKQMDETATCVILMRAELNKTSKKYNVGRWSFKIALILTAAATTFIATVKPNDSAQIMGIATGSTGVALASIVSYGEFDQRWARYRNARDEIQQEWEGFVKKYPYKSTWNVNKQQFLDEFEAVTKKIIGTYKEAKGGGKSD